MQKLLAEIRDCTICAEHLSHGPRPVLAAAEQSKILIIGQAPGLKVHESGVPWDDQSGETLRSWLAIDEETFYNEQLIGIIPMGFCYPGKGKTGDLPPRPECADTWHEKLLSKMNSVELTLVIGQYAQARYLGKRAERNLTETVRAWKNYLPAELPLPHPSPLNFRWQGKNPWFKEEVLPALKERVSHILK